MTHTPPLLPNDEYNQRLFRVDMPGCVHSDAPHVERAR